ncbi:MAG: hypothetical protein ACRDQE_02130 [Gaiellales bacterium]
MSTTEEGRRTAIEAGVRDAVDRWNAAYPGKQISEEDAREVLNGQLQANGLEPVGAPEAAPAPETVEPFVFAKGAVPTPEQAALMSFDQKALLDEASPDWEDEMKQRQAWERASAAQAERLEADVRQQQHVELYETDESYRAQVDATRAANRLADAQHTLGDVELLNLAGAAGNALAERAGDLSAYTLDRLTRLEARLVPDPARPPQHPGGFPLKGRAGLWRLRSE